MLVYTSSKLKPITIYTDSLFYLYINILCYTNLKIFRRGLFNYDRRQVAISDTEQTQL